MTDAKQSAKTVALLVCDGFEQSELTEPRRQLQEAGIETVLISTEGGEVRGWKKTDWADSFPVDKTVSESAVEEFDALVLPGGQMNPDNLRQKPEAIEFIRAFALTGKPVAAICHGPWTLIDADVVGGRRLTSYPSLRRDLENAGADWVDEEVVRDSNLITSRKPDDLDAFCACLMDALDGVQPDRELSAF